MKENQDINYGFPKVFSVQEAENLFTENINSHIYIKRFNPLNYDIPFVFGVLAFLLTFAVVLICLTHYHLMNTDAALFILLGFIAFPVGFYAGLKTSFFKKEIENKNEFCKKIFVDNNTSVGQDYCKKSLEFLKNHPEYQYYFDGVVTQGRKILIDEVDFLIQDAENYKSYCNCQKIYQKNVKQSELITS